TGSDAPFDDSFHRPSAGSGNDCTYTSIRPVSADSYASHRPSGEKLGFDALDTPLRYGRSSKAPWSDIVHSSGAPSTLATSATSRPSAEIEDGIRSCPPPMSFRA